MIYSIDEIKSKIKIVAERYDIKEIRLFGSYYDRTPTESSDVDLIVTYGSNCKGLERIRFMNDLESLLGKDVDVINSNFTPEFMKKMDLNEEGRMMYVR